MRTYYCLNCGYSFSEADKSWDIAIQSNRCPKCVGMLREEKAGERPEATLDPPVSVGQNEMPFPRQPYPWGSVLMWVVFAFLVGFISTHPPKEFTDSSMQSAMRVIFGAVYAAITAIVVGVYKYFNRKPNQFFSGFISDKPNQNTAEAHEDRLYAQIAQELDTDTVDKALWTKAYAQAGGDEKQTRVLYIKARFARMRDMKDA